MHPFLDCNGILRVGGHLQKSLLSFDEKHPIILPKRDQLSYLIVLQAHTLTLHGGQQLTLSQMLSRYWIIGAKILIVQVIRPRIAPHAKGRLHSPGGRPVSQRHRLRHHSLLLCSLRHGFLRLGLGVFPSGPSLEHCPRQLI